VKKQRISELQVRGKAGSPGKLSSNDSVAIGFSDVFGRWPAKKKTNGYRQVYAPTPRLQGEISDSSKIPALARFFLRRHETPQFANLAQS
jgi:hypothetical protein